MHDDGTPPNPSARREIEFPINLSEHHDLVAGLFNVLVGTRFYELLDEANEPEKVPLEASHRHLAQAIRDIAHWFPVSIKGRFTDGADVMAAQMIGAEVVIPRRRP